MGGGCLPPTSQQLMGDALLPSPARCAAIAVLMGRGPRPELCTGVE